MPPKWMNGNFRVSEIRNGFLVAYTLYPATGTGKWCDEQVYSKDENGVRILLDEFLAKRKEEA
jgi:hypothetical protein